MSESPLVSVLLPVYNSENFIEDAILSILSQSYNNIEVIVIDDCSTDSSLSKIVNINDTRLKIFQNTYNLKIVETLNKGIEYCSGKYIARMDSDDICNLDRVSKQVEVLEERENCVLVGSSIKRFGISSKEWKIYRSDRELRAELLGGTALPHPSVMIRASVFRQGKIKYDSKFLYAEDRKLWIDISKHGELLGIVEPLLNYRTHDKSTNVLQKEAQVNVNKEVTIYALKSLLGVSDYELRLKRIDYLRSVLYFIILARLFFSGLSYRVGKKHVKFFVFDR